LYAATRTPLSRYSRRARRATNAWPGATGPASRWRLPS
jgi:hypothetical protein